MLIPEELVRVNFAQIGAEAEPSSADITGHRVNWRGNLTIRLGTRTNGPTQSLPARRNEVDHLWKVEHGIPTDKVPLLFEKFTLADSSITRLFGARDGEWQFARNSSS